MLGALITGASSLLGGAMNNLFAKDAAEESYENAKNMVQHHISWVVKDAKRNGIHPLAALGVNPASGPPPASVFDSGIGAAGQAIGDAVERTMDPQQKLQLAMQRLALEKSTLDNDFMRSQIASQRMRNIQQSTPGVKSTTGNDVLVNPMTDQPFPAKYSTIGQDAENAYSDIGGNLFGLGGFIADMVRNNPDWGLTPKQLWDDPVGAATGAVRRGVDQYVLDNYDVNPENYQWGF